MLFRSARGHSHCSASTSQNNAVSKFVDKFLYGNNNANTNILSSTFGNVNYNNWISSWKDHTFSENEDNIISEVHWVEAESKECAQLGDNYNIIDDNNASNNKYVTVKSGLNSISDAPKGEENYVIIP